MKELLLNYLAGQSRIIIYGAGFYGKLIKWIMDKHNIPICCFADRDSKLWNCNIEEISCISPEELGHYTDAVVLVSPRKYESILRFLSQYEFSKILVWDDLEVLIQNADDDLCEYRRYMLAQDHELKGRLAKNKQYHNCHAGERCFVIGNGPSIRNQNLGLLGDEITFTVNQIARAPYFDDINTQYHLWADPNFFKSDMDCEGDYQLLEVMKKLPNTATSFFPYSYAKEYIKRFDLEASIDVNFYEPSSLVMPHEDIDFESYIRPGYSVVQYAIRLAIYMGFKEIYLLGCECTTIINVINARTREYLSTTHAYDIGTVERERAHKMYMGMSMQDHYRSEIGLLDEYEQIQKYCAERSIKVFNCTLGGLLDVFPRCRFEDVL